MPCELPQPVYRPHAQGGVSVATSRGDGYTIALQWDRAYPSTSEYQVGYNIYYSTTKDDVHAENTKYVVISSSTTDTLVIELTPGQTYFFSVRAFQYQPAWYNLNQLPDGGGLKTYPETVLTSDITDTDLIIPVADIDQFPALGVIVAGTELIRYSSKDIPNSTLIVADIDDRGFLGTNVRSHDVDGYDGVYEQSPIIRFWNGYEDDNLVILQETSVFAYPNYAFTEADGYKKVTTDILTSDLSSTDENMADFREYDYAGWHRTDPALLFRGGCIGTYIGGEQYCADGYLGVGRQIRNIPINEQAYQRLEMQLRASGERCVLLRRQRTGIRCSCFLPHTEHPDNRCPKCYGVGFVMGYEQFFNERRSDGRLLVRFEPATDDLKIENAGLESELIPAAWTLGYPTIKDRDVLVRYDENGFREFSYEVLHVTRNKLFFGDVGVQKMTLQRIRRTDPINQVALIDDTSQIPESLTTSIGFIRSAGGVLTPHTHTIRINEDVVTLAQINQLTSVSEDHNHRVEAGIVQEVLGHTHTIVLI